MGLKMMVEIGRFQQGDAVQVRTDDPPRHHRTPWYVKGKIGRIDAIYEPWPNPEEMAYGRTDGPHVPVYRVEFDQRDLWESYEGPDRDRLVVDIFEHWLDPADGSSR
jgi:nitrile hydratase subunit beta